MTETTYNLNCNMAVTLTELGRKILTAHLAKEAAKVLPQYLKSHSERIGRKLNGDEWTDQGWRIMEVFGPHIYPHGPMPFSAVVVVSNVFE